MFDVATQAKLFNEYITPGVQAEIKARSKMWDRIQKSDKIELGGLYARVKMLMAASQSSGARSDASYPDAQESTPGEGKVYLKRAQMFTLKFDGMSMELAAKTGTPIAPEEFEKKGIFITVADDMSRQLWGDGSGRLCQAKGLGSTSTALIVDHAKYANLKYFLKPNRVIDVVKTGSKELNSQKVSAFDEPTQTATVPSSTWSDDADVYNEDAYSATEGAGLGEMMGLQGIIRTTDPPAPNATAGLQGLLVATYPEWKANVKSNSGVKRPITEDLIVSGLDDGMEYGNISVLLGTLKIRRAYADLLVAYKTISNQEVLWGGWSGLPFIYDGKKIPLVADRFCPDGNLFGLDESRLTIFCTDKKAQVTWEKGYGASSAILQKVAGYNQYQAEGHIFSNLGTDLRKAFVVIEDIDESDYA